MLKHTFSKKALAVIVPIVVFIVLAALSGVIGNGTYAFLPWIWQHVIEPLGKYLLTFLWYWIIDVIIGLAAICSLLYLWRQLRVLHHALDTASSVVDLDDSLLRLLASLTSAQDIKSQMVKLLEELLRDAIRTFPGETYRGCILLPNNNKEHLQIRANYEMSASSIQLAKFYIGHDENRKSERGMAGNTFLDGQLRIGHIIWKNNQWECDHEDYIVFDTDHPHPPYYSLVCVPIIGPSPKSSKPSKQSSVFSRQIPITPAPSSTSSTPITCLGVVCFDSHHNSVFDYPEIQTLLVYLGRRIAAAMTVYLSLLDTQDRLRPSP